MGGGEGPERPQLSVALGHRVAPGYLSGKAGGEESFHIADVDFGPQGPRFLRAAQQNLKAAHEIKLAPAR